MNLYLSQNYTLEKITIAPKLLMKHMEREPFVGSLSHSVPWFRFEQSFGLFTSLNYNFVKFTSTLISIKEIEVFGNVMLLLENERNFIVWGLLSIYYFVNKKIIWNLINIKLTMKVFQFIYSLYFAYNNRYNHKKSKYINSHYNTISHIKNNAY